MDKASPIMASVLTLCLIGTAAAASIACNSTREVFTYKIRDTHTDWYCLTCVNFKTQLDTIIIKDCIFNEYLNQTLYREINNDRRFTVTNIKRGVRFKDRSNKTKITNGPYVRENYHWLDFSFNTIDSITTQSFKNIKGLIILNLNNNNISVLDVDAFDGLTTLQILNLQFNKIERLNDGIFKSLTDLFHIDLGNNKLTVISPNLFNYQEHLSEVLLNNNDIISLDCICWNSPRFAIDIVDISWNKLNSTRAQSYIRQLRLNHNNLFNFTAQSANFTILRLDSNNFKHFSVNLTSSINILNLSRNHLSSIPEHALSNATGLTSLDLSFNQLKSLSTDSLTNMKNLTSLNIAYNLLSQRGYGTENNWISLFLQFDRLEAVSLDSNLWKCEDLRDMIQTFKFRSIKVTPGVEYSKSNVLGIGCLDQNNTSLSNSSVDSEFLNQVFKEMWTKLSKADHVESEMSNKITSEYGQLKSVLNNVVSNKADIEDFKKRLDRIEFLLRNTSDTVDPDFHDTTVSIIEVTGTDHSKAKINENIADKLIQPKDELHSNKTEQLLQAISDSNSHSVSLEIVLVILLVVILCLLIFLTFTTRYHKQAKSNETINLFST